MSCACSNCFNGDCIASIKHMRTISDRAPVVVSRSRTWVVNVLFLLVGVGVNSTWNAIGFAMAFFVEYYSDTIGSEAWTLLVLCYNLPGFPIQFAQLLLKCKSTPMSNRTTSKTDFIFILFGFTSLSVALLLIPCLYLLSVSSFISFLIVCFIVLMIGMIQASLFGWVFQMASLFPSPAFGAMPSTLGGMGISTFILLFLTLIEKFDAKNATPADLFIYFAPTCMLPIIGGLAVLLLRLLPTSRVFLLNLPQNEEGLKTNKQQTNEIEMESFTRMICDSCCCAQPPIIDSLELEESTHVPSPLAESSEGRESCSTANRPEKEVEKPENSDNNGTEPLNMEFERNWRSIVGLIGSAKYSMLSSFLIGSSLVFLTSTLPLIYNSNMGQYFLTMVMYTQSISLFFGNELAAFLILVKRATVLLPLVFLRFFL